MKLIRCGYKLAASFIVATFVFGCQMPHTQHTSTVSKLPFEIFIDSLFNRNPNCLQNEIYFEKLNSDYKKSFVDSLLLYNLVEGIPFELAGMTKTSKGVALKFHDKINNTNNNWNLILPTDYLYPYQITAIITGYVNEDIAIKLTTGEIYKIYGKFIRLGNLKDIFNDHGSATGFDLEFQLTEIYRETYPKTPIKIGKLNMGILHYKIDSVCIFNGK